MAIDQGILRQLAEADIDAVPAGDGRLLTLTHRPTGITLERPVFADALNVSHGIGALLTEAGKTGWAARDSNPERAT